MHLLLQELAEAAEAVLKEMVLPAVMAVAVMEEIILMVMEPRAQLTLAEAAEAALVHPAVMMEMELMAALV